MTELRPVLAIIGLLVVAGGLFFWIARLRGWRLEWWDRFFSPGRRRGPVRAAGEPGAARPGQEVPGRPRSSSEGRSREPDRAAARRSGAGPGRQTLIDLDFLPLLDPEDAVPGTSHDRELAVGDLGSVETGDEDAIRPSRTRAASSAPAPERAPQAPEERLEERPEERSESGRRPASQPRPPPAEEDRRAGGSAEGDSEPPGESRELLIVLTILAPEGHTLAGPAIHKALAAFDLRPDDQGMFHHYGHRRGPLRGPVFSVANVLEPGVFDLAAMDELVTSGLCLFMHRPGPLPAGVAFDLMLDVGTRLSRALGSVLCDDQRCRLTVQATQALRERVVHFALRHERGTTDAG